MAFVHGKDATMSVDAQAITAFTDSTSLNKVKDLFETTVFGNDNKTFIDGLREHDISIGGKWDAALDLIMANADDGASVLFDFSPDGGTTSFTGSSFISNYNIDSPVGGGVTWTASFKPTGVVTRA